MSTTSSRDLSESLPIFQRKRSSILCGHKHVRHYLLGELLGEGSYGKVNEALDEETNEICAIKIIKKRHLPAIPGGEQNVQREVEILKTLQHKSIIRLIDDFTDEERQKIYLVFEHVGGGSLQDLLERAPNKRLPLCQARRIFGELLDALEYLHSHNIIHRDLKPSNMLFTESGDMKLSDFSVAVQLDKISTNATHRKCTGSPAFQPPELLTDPLKGPCGFSGPKIDIWAAGVTLYMMCVGAFPFEGTSVCALFENISKATYKIPCWIDPCLADLLKGILNKDPGQRLTIDQIRQHPWMTKKLKREKCIPMCLAPTAFCDAAEHKKIKLTGCQCVIS